MKLYKLLFIVWILSFFFWYTKIGGIALGEAIESPQTNETVEKLSEPIRFEKATEGTFLDEMQEKGLLIELPGYVTENQEVLDEWYFEGRRNLHSVPRWKYDITQRLDIAEPSARKMFAFNNLECGREDGFCQGDNGYSYGPFQIHGKYHPEASGWSQKLVRAGWYSQYSEEERKRLYQVFGIPEHLLYETPHQIAEKLYEFQVNWLAQRMVDFEKRICHTKETHKRKTKCQGIMHNGGLSYGLKAEIVWELLTENK